MRTLVGPLLNGIILLALVGATGCVAIWGRSYNVAEASSASVVVEYDPAVIDYPAMERAAQIECERHGKGAVLDSTGNGNYIGIRVNTYRCEYESQKSSPGRNPLVVATCFAVSEDKVLTSHHVVDGADTITVQFADGVDRRATIRSQSQSADLALLAISQKAPAILPLAPARAARTGEQVFTLGFPATNILGEDAKFTEGSISSLSGIRGDMGYFQMSVPVQPGNSGGPVVNNRGEVVGIVAATAAIEAFYSATGALPQNVNWASKSENARLLFDPPETTSTALSREDAIGRVQAALCKVTATAD